MNSRIAARLFLQNDKIPRSDTPYQGIVVSVQLAVGTSQIIELPGVLGVTLIGIVKEVAVSIDAQAEITGGSGI